LTFASGYCNTKGIYCDMCLPGFAITCQIVLELSKADFVTYIGLLWPWPLTFWPPKLTVSWPCAANHFCQFYQSRFIHFGNYRVPVW